MTLRMQKLCCFCESLRYKNCPLVFVCKIVRAHDKLLPKFSAHNIRKKYLRRVAALNTIRCYC